jgi:hypothetical protein
MDSSDAGPLRLFNFGETHVAGVLTMTALADFYNKHAAGHRMQNPGSEPNRLSVHSQDRDSALIKRRYRRSFGGFVIRHSSFVIRRGFEAENLATRLRHPRIARNAKAFAPFQNGSAH